LVGADVPRSSVAAAAGDRARIAPRILAGLFALAFALRAFYLLEMRDSPLFAAPYGDGLVYDAWARRIAFGEGWGSARYYHAPLYPWFLAAVYTISPSLEAARWAQALLGSLACVLLAIAAARLLDRRAGIVAGALLAVYAPAIAYEAMIEKAALDVLAICALLALLADPRPRSLARCFAAGAVLAAATINRENLLVAFAVVVPWTVARTRRSRLASLALLAAGCAAVYVPASLQQLAVHGELTPWRGQLGLNLYIGNHAGADGLYQPLRRHHGTPLDEELDAAELASASAGRPLGRAEVSAFWRDEALRWMREHPREALALLARKLRYTLHDTEWSDSQGYSAFRDESRLLGLLGVPFRFGTLVALAVYGFVSAHGARAKLRPLAALVVLLSLACAAFFVFGRFRLSLVPLLIPFAASAVTHVARRGGFDRRRRIAVAATALALASAWGPTEAKDTGRVDTWANASAALLDAGRNLEAEELLRRALERAPDDPALHARLAAALAARAAWSQAQDERDRAIALDPGWSGRAQFELGVAAARAGDLGRAVLWLRAAAEAQPDEALYWSKLGLALRQSGRAQDAEAAYRRALALRPRDPDALNDLGYLLELAGRVEEAARCYEAALEIDPDHPQARGNRERAAGAR
jgi:Flp pilus assembly protein TadD